MSQTEEEQQKQQPPADDKEEEGGDGSEKEEQDKKDEREEEGKRQEAAPEYKYHDFVVESLPFRSTTEYKKRSQITKLKYAEYEHEWPDVPHEGNWIGCINNVIQKELVMIGRVVAVARKSPPPPKQDHGTAPPTAKRNSKKRKPEAASGTKLSDIEFEVQVVVLSPYGFSSNDAQNDPRWKPAPGKATIQVPFSARVCRVRHDPDFSFRHNRSRW